MGTHWKSFLYFSAGTGKLGIEEYETVIGTPTYTLLSFLFLSNFSFSALYECVSSLSKENCALRQGEIRKFLGLQSPFIEFCYLGLLSPALTLNLLARMQTIAWKSDALERQVGPNGWASLASKQVHKDEKPDKKNKNGRNRLRPFWFPIYLFFLAYGQTNEKREREELALYRLCKAQTYPQSDGRLILKDIAFTRAVAVGKRGPVILLVPLFLLLTKGASFSALLGHNNREEAAPQSCATDPQSVQLFLPSFLFLFLFDFHILSFSFFDWIRMFPDLS